VGLLGASLYLVGGMGIREKDWPAAAVLFACYLVDTFSNILTGMIFTPGGVLRIIFLGLLLTNLRATFIASEWKPVAEGEERPQRFNETLRDKLADVWPPVLWPRLQIPFYVLGALWFVVSSLALVAVLLVRLGLLSLPASH
jgi:hypothetical protein